MSRFVQVYPDVPPKLTRDILQRRADGYSIDTVATYAGMTRPQIEAFLRRKRPEVRRWRPLCMSADEFELWDTPTLSSVPDWGFRPCDVCEKAFAAENRAAGTCNGTLPGEVAA